MILKNVPEIGAWRWMYATAIIPAMLVTIGRFFVTESGHWLLAHGSVEEATRATERLLAREPPYPREIHLSRRMRPHA